MANYSRRNATAAELAAVRADKMDSAADRALYLRTFARVRKMAPALAATPLDLETVCDMTRDSSVMEAAMIEALASLRAEGFRL
jgi:adenosylmethionine-8-amino-7-oxononanoate aminotransferase